jgi:hypothetical protein
MLLKSRQSATIPVISFEKVRSLGFDKDMGYFLVGDLACPLMGHLLFPHSNAKSLSPEDAFNLWLSNSQIHIECKFWRSGDAMWHSVDEAAM